VSLAHVLANYGKKQVVSADGTVILEARHPRKKREQCKHGGRPAKYREKAFIGALTLIWIDHGQPCGKLLAPMIREMIDFLAESKDIDYGITAEIKVMLVKISGAQIDRLLAPARKAQEIRGISTTSSLWLLWRRARRYVPKCRYKPISTVKR
jgi:hypothetical protein